MRVLIALMLAAGVAGCAAPPNGGQGASAANGPDSVYGDPTYRGAGAHIGIGVGRWGGRSGGSVGIGVGF